MSCERTASARTPLEGPPEGSPASASRAGVERG